LSQDKLLTNKLNLHPEQSDRRQDRNWRWKKFRMKNRIP